MMGLRLGLGLSRGTGGAVSAYAAYALALDFDNPEYWVSGTQYSPITTIPGYTFTRSGEQGAVDASGAVQYFAANIPAINSAGYHAYGALTNALKRSQEINDASAWANISNTVMTGNTVAAPDGTTTADTVAENTANTDHYVNQIVDYVNATVYTYSVFAKANTATVLQLYASVLGWCNFDLANGVLGSSSGVTGHITSVGNGWYRCSMVGTASSTSTAGTFLLLTNNNAAAGLGPVYLGTSQSLYVWQAQVILGNFPDGGPIIVTGAATASIGASALSTTTNPYTADTDFIMWSVVDFKAANTADNDTIFQLGANILAHRDAANEIKLFGPDLITSGVTVTSGRAIILIRRRAGKWTILCKKAGGVATLSVDTVVAFPATTTALTISAAAGPLEGENEGLFARTGTFSDVEITAIADAAVT